MAEIGQEFLDDACRFLEVELLPRVRGAVEPLPIEDLWWRPNEASNSIGNLVLHLAGNVRQWIVSGVGGGVDVRRREEEFSARDPLPADALLTELERSVSDAVAVIRALSPDDLLRRAHVQGRDVTVLHAIFHVVEHFSMHAGQIFYINKLRLGADLGFYAIEAGVPRPRWKGFTARPDR